MTFVRRRQSRCGILRAAAVILGLLLGALLTPINALAQGEHGRRAAAELLVIKGDLRSIKAPDLSDSHRKGLTDRIKGGLVGLEILMRYADEENSREVKSRREAVLDIFDAVDAADYFTANEAIDRLIEIYPLKIPTLVSESPEKFLPLHKTLCAVCHDKPVLAVERPAFNLFTQAQSVSKLEMFARLLTGVRGDRVTGIDNPLTDVQLMGLLTLYLTGNTETSKGSN